MTTHTDNDLIRINAFRPVDGLRTPWIILLDRQRNVVGDYMDEEQLARIKASPHMLARHQLVPQPAPPVDAKTLSRQSGIHRHVTEKGIVLSKTPLNEWEVNFERWLDSALPNPFEDPVSSELRLAYFEEKADAERRIAEGNCPGCELNRLQVDYSVKLRRAQDVA